MKKIATLLTLSLVMTIVPAIAQDMVVPSEDTRRSFDDVVKDYNFADTPYYQDDQKKSDTNVSDQSQKPQVQEEKPSFWARVIDSGHFSSKTATETYKPLNKY